LLNFNLCPVLHFCAYDIIISADGVFQPAGRVHTIDGVENIDPASAEAEFEKYQAELIYNFELYNWETDEQPQNNINEMLEELAAMSTQ